MSNASRSVRSGTQFQLQPDIEQWTSFTSLLRLPFRVQGWRNYDKHGVCELLYLNKVRKAIAINSLIKTYITLKVTIASRLNLTGRHCINLIDSLQLAYVHRTVIVDERRQHYLTVAS